MLECWENAAQNLIDHFRAVCRGHIPLNIEWTRAEQDAANVDDQSLDFINHLREIAQSRGLISPPCRLQMGADGPHQWIIFVKSRGHPPILR